MDSAQVEQAVVEHALRRGMLDSAALARARQEQASRQAGGESVPLLVVLRERYLPPAALPELEEVYRAAVGSGRLRTVDLTSVPHTTPRPRSGSKRIRTTAAEGGARTSVDEPPAQIGKYEVLGELARGGMGVVYRARDPELNREVAIKVLQRGENPASRERFQIEAQACSRLRHPNIVSIHGVGETEAGSPYLVMDFVRGRSLAEELIAEGPLDPRRAAALTAKLCDAVHTAHAQLILHRDLKPANVLVDERGEPLLTDFGLAKHVEREGTPAGPTVTGAVLGTPAFMPPEQAGGRLVDFRADVYGLGATLYALLTGRPPFDGENMVEVLVAVASDDPPPPSRYVDLPRDLETICLRCLEKEPDRRYATAQGLGADLLRFLADESIEARPPTPLDRLLRWARRNRTVAGVVAAAAAVLLIVGAVAAVGVLRADQRARTDLIAAARAQAESSWDAWAGTAVVDTDTRLGLALAALQAAQAWRTQAPDAADAAKAQYDAALALGTLALADAQWSLARQAFAQAEVGVDDDGARRRLVEVETARTREARRRASEVRRWLARAKSGELSRLPQGATEAVFAIVRYPGPETVALLADALDEVTRALIEVEAEALRQVAAPTADEAKVGGEHLDLEPALALRATLPPKLTPEQVETLRILEQALRRLERRAARKLPAQIQTTAPDALAILGERQTERLGAGPLALAEVCCRALGRLGGPRARAALADYLWLECDRGRAVHAGVALARLGDDQELERAFQRFGVNSSFGTAISRFQRARTRGAGLPPTASAEPERALERAARLHRLGDHRAALAVIEAVLRESPADAEAHCVRGSALAGLGRRAEARAALNRSIAIRPSAVALLSRISYRLDDLDYAGALQDANTAVELEPRMATVWSVRGYVRQLTKDYRGSLEDLARALQLDPNSGTAWARQGRTRHLSGDRAGARRDLDKAVAVEPNAAVVYLIRARTRIDEGDLRGALQDLNRKIELDPKAADGYEERGHLRLLSGRPRPALKDYDTALRLDPRSGRSWTGWANAQSQVGAHDKAIQGYTKAIEYWPRRPEPWANRGNIKLERGDVRGALADLDKAIEVDPSYAYAYTNKGYVLQNTGKPQAALRWHDKALKLDPRLTLGWANRAQTLVLLDRFKEAEACFDKALAIDPRRPLLYYNRGNVRLKRGRLDDALADYREAVRRHPGLVRVWSGIGHTLNLQRKFPEALSAFQRALQLDPRDPVAWLGRAAVKANMGQRAAAIADYREAMRRVDKGSPYYRIAQKELNALLRKK